MERDPKTGVTVVRSVAPVATPPGGTPMAATVFDDGRKSIHAVGGAGVQPSSEELGQILSVIDGVGMKVLLDEVAVTPNKAEIKIEGPDDNRAPKGTGLSLSTRYDVSEEDNAQLHSSASYSLEAEAGIEDKEDIKEDRGVIMVGDIAEEIGNVGDRSLEENPVTLVFLGYADSTNEQGHDQDEQGVIKVERVMITDEGVEHVIGDEAPAAPQAEKESQVFQDVPLEGNGEAVDGVKAQVDGGQEGTHNSSPQEKGDASKRKTCQCCSVM